MKRLVILPAFLIVFSTLARTQAEPPAPSGHDHSQSSERAQNMCQRMMGEEAAEMKATTQALASNLAQMKATLPLISDINERSRWQSNIAMWQAVADHFNHMAEHAEHMEKMGMGCGMMMGQGMDDHAGHEHTMPATPAKPQ